MRFEIDSNIKYQIYRLKKKEKRPTFCTIVQEALSAIKVARKGQETLTC